MKYKKNRVFIGDIIVTKDSFKPMINDKDYSVFDTSFLYGIVVSKKGNEYGVRFGKGLDFTSHLDGLLKNKTGYVLNRKDFELFDE